LVFDAKPQIKLIADALLQHGALTGDEVYGLISSASRIQPAPLETYVRAHHAPPVKPEEE
jgi:hypothetical protein